MGGLGSGQSTCRRTVESMLDLDVRKLQRKGMLEHNVRSVQSWSSRGELFAQANVIAGSDSINIAYTLTDRLGHKSDVEQHVWLTTTTCNFGGERVWFDCPQCARRVAIVYLSKIVACRKCQDVNYQCQRETDSDRTLRRLHKIQDKLLAGTYSAFEPPPQRPAGMKQRKYNRLVREYAQVQQQALNNLATAVNRL